MNEVEGQRHVLDVEQFVLQLLERVFHAGAVRSSAPAPIRSGPAARRDAGRRTESRCVSSSTNSGRSGRGPTRLMSPDQHVPELRQLVETRVRRRNRPIGVTRASPGCAHTGPVLASASARIDRNLCTVKTRPSMTHALPGGRGPAPATSSGRAARRPACSGAASDEADDGGHDVDPPLGGLQRRASSWKPDEKISQLGRRFSTAIFPVYSS